MREELLDILDRLMAVERALGRAAFESACHGARVGIGQAVLARAVNVTSKRRRARSPKLTKEPEQDSSSIRK